jgi:hypothetical protein
MEIPPRIAEVMREVNRRRWGGINHRGTEDTEKSGQ